MMSVPDVKVVDEIPGAMQRLVRYVVRGFYGIEHSVLIDLLIRNVCMREDDLRDLLRFDAKQLRAVIISLKASKIIKERQLVEQKADGKSFRQNYYFINYRALLSIMKYKIDHMRKKLESEEKTSTHRSTFKCTKCLKPYTDLDINLLWNGEEMQCTFCRGVVEEDASAVPSQRARSSMARFNEQLWPFFRLMQELEGVQLAMHLLEPTPVVLASRLRAAGGDRSAPAPSAGGRADGKRGGKSGDGGLKPYETGFTVDIDGADGRSAAGAGARDVPIWLQSSTVVTTTAHDHDSAAVDSLQKHTIGSLSPSHGDIAHTLLTHETAAASSSRHIKFEIEEDRSSKISPFDYFSAADRQEEGAGSEQAAPGAEELDDDEEDADEDEDLKVDVAGKSYSLAEVMDNPDLINDMTPDEKQLYVKVSQAAYERMYGD